MTTILIFFVAHWYLSLFVQTFFLHRYAAHQMLTMSPFMEKIFFVLTFIGQGSSYLSARAYGYMHRLHHVYADTEKDPHSPMYSKGLMDMMWKTKDFYTDISYNRVPLNPVFSKNLPTWNAFDRFADHWLTRVSWGAFYVLFYVAFAPNPWWYLLIPVHFAMGPVHGAIINWFAHKYGYVTYKVKDTSKNFLPFDFLMMGESYHNNHHPHPHDINFGKKWFEIDPTYYIALALDFVGVIKLNKNTTTEVESDEVITPT